MGIYTEIEVPSLELRNQLPKQKIKQNSRKLQTNLGFSLYAFS